MIRLPEKDDWPGVQDALRRLQAQITQLKRTEPSDVDVDAIVRQVLSSINVGSASSDVELGGALPRIVASDGYIGTSQLGSRSDHIHPAMTQAARVTHSIDQSIANNTETTLAFDSPVIDSDTDEPMTTTANRITFVEAGTYIVGASVAFAPDAVGYRDLSLSYTQGMFPGTENWGSVRVAASPTTQTRLSVTTLVQPDAGFYLQATVRQTSGGALNVTSDLRYSPILWAQRIWTAGIT